jgi:PBP1b-binding outer membrane lipoprotein LpoB
VLVVCLALALAGCARSEPAPAPTTPATGSTTASVPATPTETSVPTDPVPRTLRPSDDGGWFSMVLGSTCELLVSDTSAGDPVVEGTSVLLVPVVNITDSGVREWEVRAVEPGTSTVTGVDPDYSFTITVS